jgi:hypothetical protein
VNRLSGKSRVCAADPISIKSLMDCRQRRVKQFGQRDSNPTTDLQDYHPQIVAAEDTDGQMIRSSYIGGQDLSPVLSSMNIV